MRILENFALILFGLGGLGAILFDQLAMEAPKNIRLGVVMLGIAEGELGSRELGVGRNAGPSSLRSSG